MVYSLPVGSVWFAHTQWCCCSALASEGVSPDFRHMLAQYSNLVAYNERIRATYFDAELRFEETEED